MMLASPVAALTIHFREMLKENGQVYTEEYTNKSSFYFFRTSYTRMDINSYTGIWFVSHKI